MKNLFNWLRDKLDSSEERIYELEPRPLKKYTSGNKDKKKKEKQKEGLGKMGKKSVPDLQNNIKLSTLQQQLEFWKEKEIKQEKKCMKTWWLGPFQN